MVVVDFHDNSAVSQVFLCSAALCWFQADDYSCAKSPEVSRVLELPSFSTKAVYLEVPAVFLLLETPHWGCKQLGYWQVSLEITVV